MVVAPKSNEKVTVCVDLTQLNKSVRREHFLLLRLSDTIASQERSKAVSEMEANSGLRKQWESQERRILIFRISLLIVRISFENSERIIIIYRASISAFLEIRLVCTNVPLWLKNNWPGFIHSKTVSCGFTCHIVCLGSPCTGSKGQDATGNYLGKMTETHGAVLPIFSQKRIGLSRKKLDCWGENKIPHSMLNTGEVIHILSCLWRGMVRRWRVLTIRIQAYVHP